MIISDLRYLEVVSEVPSIMGGEKDKDTVTVKEKNYSQKITVKIRSDNNTIFVDQSVEIFTSNEGF